MPRIPDNHLDCVFYLYPSEEDARAGRNAGGTGFLASVNTVRPPRFFTFAVANWHVARQAGASVIRLMRKDGGIDIFPHDPADWFFDPKGHDIAILPIKLQVEHVKAYVPIDEIETAPGVDSIGIGDDVYMIGRFVDHDGGEIDRPTVRFGNISMMPTPMLLPNGNRLEMYCVDMHSRSGYSGSPVFVFRTPGGNLSDTRGEGGSAKVLFAGASLLMPLGIHVAQFPEIWKIRNVKTDVVPTEGVGLKASEQHIEGVSGMTCVAPMSAIRDLLELPKLKKSIADANARIAAETPDVTVPVPESAAPKRPAMEGDEQHKERFTSVLDEVVGKPRQGR